MQRPNMRTFAISLGVAAAAMIAGVVLAATPGTLGTTSTGTLNINSSKTAAVQISGLSDISFAASSTPPTPQSSTACIYSTDGQYNITATSGNAGGTTGYQLANAANRISYSVDWFTQAAGGTDIPLTAGTQSNTILGANQTSTSCNSVNNTHVQVTIDTTTFNSAPAGGYTDTLTLTAGAV